MSVTAVVLSIGEESTSRAVRAIEQQTHPCEKMIIIRNVSPFYKAMNKGIAKVKTPYFLQCDSDMVPDPDCIEVMLNYMTEEVGIVMAYLSDELLGQVQAIKLFRTECFKNVAYPNSLSTHTASIQLIKHQGYQAVFAKRSKLKFDHPRDVLGSHLPNYNPAYTFQKFKLEGARIRFRGVYKEFITCMEKLKKSKHAMARIALIGLCHGLFDQNASHGIKSKKDVKEFEDLKKFMLSDNKKNLDFIITKQDDNIYMKEVIFQ